MDRDLWRWRTRSPAIQYAKAMGLLVGAIDIDDSKLAHATRLGADL
jgi:alcohol dehydrogenase, propanol-preferring